jgi:hypothetical protein
VSGRQELGKAQGLGSCLWEAEQVLYGLWVQRSHTSLR